MASKVDLQEWVLEALRASGGSASIVEVARHIWENHREELEGSGDLFYTWQYDMRWAATELRKQRRLADADQRTRGPWHLA